MLESEFGKFGNIEYCRITCDENGRSKGYGYVKFYRSLHGALALEGCNQEIFRPVFAAPKPQKNYSAASGGVALDSNGGKFNGGAGGYMSGSNMGWSSGREHGPIFNYHHNGQYIIELVTEGNLPPNCLNLLVNLTPGVVDFHWDDSRSVAHVTYSHPAYAAFSLDRLHNFEFSGIFRLYARYSSFGAGSGGNGGTSAGIAAGATISPGAGGGGSEALVGLCEASATLTSGPPSDEHIAKLADAIKQASNVIERYHHRGNAANTFLFDQVMPEVRCSVDLPPIVPLAEPSSAIAERCFIVCVERILPQRVLENVFCRFGALISVGLLPSTVHPLLVHPFLLFFCFLASPDKNHGFANYATSAAAEAARTTLHSQYIDGVRIKVIEAEPMRGGRAVAGGMDK